jgi:hypothetical protein
MNLPKGIRSPVGGQAGAGQLGGCNIPASANPYALIAAIIRYASAKIEQVEAERDFYKAAAETLRKGRRKK